MKFELNRLERNCNNKAILEEINRVVNLIPSKFITRKEFDKHSKISSSTVVKRLNDWSNALTKAGHRDRYYGLKISTKMHRQKGKRMKDEELISELRSIARKLGVKSLTMKIFNKHSSINAETIRRRIGWGVALNKAGLKISNLGKRYSIDDYFENLLEVWTYRGRQPKYKEMDENPSKISAGAYEAKWGQWRKSLVAFIDRVNSDIPHSNKKKVYSPKQYLSKLKPRSQQPSDIHNIPLGLRYDVLKRDHFKCVLCGDNPATNNSCKLQVDHIKPFSTGGKTVKENLRALCAKCNQGKSDKV